MGPDSVAGINRDKGLNENLARETLELHTLGVRSGYTQTDVTNFAKVLTGWTWIQPAEPVHGGEFAFVERMHERGDQTVLGKRYPDTGVEQGRAVLADLARHPATARHVAQKLAAHFVADEPPPSLVAKLEKTFLRYRRQSQGSGEEFWSSRTSPGHRSGPNSSRLRLGLSAWRGLPTRRRQSPSAACSARRRCSAKRCGGRRRRTAIPIPSRPGSTAYRADLDIADDFAGRLANNVDPWRWSTAHSVRSPAPIRARPSPARRAASRRWRFW